jgi:hypothetical protein
MSVRLQFEGIRCFSTPQDVPLRPLTLLVGENSSGKTTFLALGRIAHEISQGEVRHLPFNKPPFLLGAYDQIVSKRKGRTLRDRFALTISPENNPSQSLTAEFISRNGQPWVGLLRLSSGDRSLEVGTSIVLRSPNGVNKLPPFEPLSETLMLRHIRAAYKDLLMRAAMNQGEGFVFSDADFDSLERSRIAIRNEFYRRDLAFAPIRTSPRRTYDPVDVAEDPEGSHIPMLLAMLSRSSGREEWATLQPALNEFGSKSGLFDQIEIVNKGEGESDPFQVGIKSGGRVFNLIDVGYGVSQTLPILVDVLRQAPDIDLFLIQQPEVHLHPRAQAELGSFFATQAGERRSFVIETHSDYLVDRVRMEVRKGVLKPEDVALLYFERLKNSAVIHTLELDQDGSIINPPPGYREFFLKEELSLLGV